MQNEEPKENKEIEEKPQTNQPQSTQQIQQKQEETHDQQSAITSLKKQLEIITKESAEKDKEIAQLKSNVSEQSQKITKLQKQVESLQSLITKMIKKKDIQPKRNYDQKSTHGVYRNYHFESDQYQGTKEKQTLFNITEANLGSSRKVDSYLQNSRIGNLSGSRNSRREELLNCQNIKDVYKLPEYRNG